MELRVLKYYLTVAREENITKASQILRVTQPTLSRQIMGLEEELGVKLFTRSNHKIVLTNDGLLLKQRAEEIVALADKTARDFFRGEGGLAGEIAVGSGEMFSFDWLAEVLVAFKREHPLVRLDVFSGNADQVKERMEKGLVDVGLLLEPVDIDRYEFARVPGRETWGVLTRDDSELAALSEVRAGDLTNLPILMSGRSGVRKALSAWFGTNFENLRVAATYNLINNAAVLVRKNMGVALCLKRCDLFGDLRFMPLEPELSARSVLAWKKNRVFSPATAEFLRFAEKYVSSIDRDTS
ncbi:MAG: LysR family transcriptional regulator [Deltaproteobacteria bacterium]|jgi:DNA-binding transcriptional LysR family regulator|nr:LysR family transcriptional regulator [Deltaproteobacteria bacterium]